MPERDDIPIELTNWLRVACMGLTDSAARRVHRDALSHFSEARDKEIMAGRPEDEARAIAIRGLGDPWQRHTEELRIAPANLLEWISIATRDFVPEAEQRIRSEISAHFEDTIEAGLESGLPEDEAQHSAIKSLGDPEKANKNFKKSYLSKRDLERYEALLKASQKKSEEYFKQCFGMFLGYVSVLLIAYFCFPRAFSFIATYSVGMTLWDIVFYRLERARSCFVLDPERTKARRRFKMAVLRIYSIVMLPSIGFIWVGVCELRDKKNSYGLAIFSTVIFVSLWILLTLRELDTYESLLRKLRQWERDKEFSSDNYA